MRTRWWNCFFQLINVHDIKDVGQAKILKAETQIPETRSFELAIEKLKSHKPTDIGQIPEELIKAGGGVEKFAWRFINLLLLFGRKRNCLKSGRSRS